MKDYDKYFKVTETPKRDRKVEPNEDAMLEVTKNYGYFALLTNEPLEVSSELSSDGKLFVKFIALIYLSYLKKKIQATSLQ